MLSGIVEGIAIALFLAGAGSFLLLLKGCYVLRHLARFSSRDDTLVLLKSPMVPTISVVYTAQDASPETRANVRRLIDLHSAHHEVVLALLGISPADLEQWKREFHLFRTNRDVAARGIWEAQPPTRLLVLDLESATAPEALNAAVRAAGGSVIACIDPQAELSMEVLLRLLRPMLEEPEETVACCGVAPSPAPRTMAGRFGAIESLRCWLARGAALAGWKKLIPIPGSGLLVNKEALLACGGFVAGSVEMVLQLHGYAHKTGKPWKVAFLAEPVSSPRAADTFSGLRAQVERDQQAIAQAWRSRNRIPGGATAIGWALPGLFTDRLLRPLLETVAYLLTIGGLATGLVSCRVALLLVLCTVGTGILVSMGAVILREIAEYRGADPSEISALFFAAIPENLGYRQLRNLWLLADFFRNEPKNSKAAVAAVAARGSAA